MLKRLLLASAIAISTVAIAAADSAPYASPGPFGVGVRTLTFVDPSRPTMPYGPYDGSRSRTLDVEVWYPAETGQGLTEVRDAEAVQGGFPLIVRAHGLGGLNRDSVYLTGFLASHGYVVAAPNFPLSNLHTPAIIPTIYDIAEQPGDLSFMIDRMIELGRDPLSFLAARIDEGKIANLGHSLGGLTVLLQGYDNEFRDSRVRAVAALAPWACSLQQDFFSTSSVPSLWMGGSIDLITPYEENQQDPFERAAAPRVLVTLDGGTHINFAKALFDVEPGENPDDTFCSGTFGLFGGRPTPTPKLPSSLGDPPEIDRSTCGKICAKFDGDFMSEARQHDITRTAVLEFFEAELRGSVAAHHALVGGLDAEPDVTSTIVEAACPFGSCFFDAACTSCGQPLSIDAATPDAGDALSVLRSAVGLTAPCPACVCDVDANRLVKATDALVVLRHAVGLESELACLRAPS